jgi:lactate permease
MTGQVLLAAAPIATILVLMLALRWPAARAGVAGLAVALAVAAAAFGLGDVPGGLPGGAGGSLLEAAFTTAAILWIIVPALCIHRLQVATGAIERLREAMARLTPDPLLTALLVAWFFSLFIEGAAGFGASAALAAPFLVGLGMQPVPAVAAALLGHVVGVSFGAVGTPIVPQMTATGLAGRDLAAATAIYHGLLGWIMALAVVALLRRSFVSGGGVGPWGWGMAAAAAFLVPYVAIARWAGPELPTLGGALIGGLAFVGVLLARRRQRGPTGGRAAGLLRAAAPYVVLVTLVAVTRLAPPIRDALQAIEWRWSLADGRYGGSFQPLFHPGTLLAVAFVAGAIWQGATAGQVRGAVATTLRGLGPVVLALFAMLGLSRVMFHAGMTETLALAAADALGGVWPVAAPWVGVLGTFVTGSATASNILFTELHRTTAASVGIEVVPVLGAQGFGAAAGNAIAPFNVIAACAVVGIAGRESEVLARTIGVAMAYALLGGLLALLLAAPA